MQHLEQKHERIGIITSFCVGLPFGLLAVATATILPMVLSGEGLFSLGLMGIYGKATIGLVAAFLFSLWYAGRDIARHLADGAGLLRTSFKYSYSVNAVIWLVFMILTLVQNPTPVTILLLIPPVIAFLICTALTTVSIGLVITAIVRNRMKRHFPSYQNNS